MRVEFLGGAKTVTGSATLLEWGSLKWLVDCGMFQGSKHLQERNWHVEPYRPKDLSFILLTHAHIDHSGLIPRLVKEGFRGEVICTKATSDLCQEMLKDSGHIQEMEAEWESRKNKRSGRKEASPLYSVEDAERSLQYFCPVEYGDVIQPAKGMKLRFQDAGHILGSAIIEIWIEVEGQERKLVFSGDLGAHGHPIVKDPAVVQEGDVLWLESTYGNRLHKTMEETSQEFLNIIQRAIHDQAKVIIPAFAIERTQDIIFTLGQWIRKGLIPSIPVYIDSPLAISATEIFKKNPDCFDDETREILLGGENPLELPQMIYSRTTEESKAINEDSRPGIIIAASGMCDAGRIKHHLKHHLWREKSHIVIVGYQAEGTIGRSIVDGAKVVRLFGEEIAVKARIHTIGGFSAHADQKGLLEWLSRFTNPRLQIFLNHGEGQISMELARLIRQQLHLNASIPDWREQRILFVPGTEPPREIMEKAPQPASTWHELSRHLDSNYKRLRRKLRRRRSIEGEVTDPEQLKRLEEINRKIEEMEREL